MSVSLPIGIMILVIFITANLPWLSERFLFFIRPGDNHKKVWMRLLEWLLLYFISGFAALGMEKKITGQVHEQDWEFYVVGFCLFMVFAFPGFVYRHELKKHRRPERNREDNAPAEENGRSNNQP